MFRRKKKEEQTEQPPSPQVAPETATTEPEVSTSTGEAEAIAAPDSVSTGATETAASAEAATESAAESGAPAKSTRGNRVQKVGIVSSDKMQKTVVVRVDRLVLHMKYRRYVRRTTKFKAHDELGASVGDRVRIVETRPLSAQKRWRVVEILQKAAK
jgi:small subunit ribosomal protein S17